MSSALELLLLVAFLLSNRWQGIYFATGVLMVGSVLVFAVSWWRTRRIEPLPLIVMVLSLVLGSATLLIRDPVFIKWKFSVIEWLLACVLIGSQLLGRKSFIRMTMEQSFELPEAVWARLTFMWAGFFLFLGCLNVYVLLHYSTDAWVNFKVYGSIGLTLLFALAQSIYLSRHLKTKEDT